MILKNIIVREDGFEQRSVLRRSKISWKDITSIYGATSDRITYDELFLKICDKDNLAIVVGEFDENFSSLENALKEHIRGFPSDWRSLLELIEAHDFRLLWRR